MCSNTAAPTATRQEFFLFLFLTVVGGLELYRTPRWDKGSVLAVNHWDNIYFCILKNFKFFYLKLIFFIFLDILTCDVKNKF